MSKLFSRSGLIGCVIGITFIVGSLLASGHIDLFWNLPSLFIIVGGTVSAVIMAFPFSRLSNFSKVFMKAFDKDKYDLREEVLAILALAQIARREGLLALESAVDEYTSDAFVKRGILLIVDGADEEQLRNSLEGTIYFMKLRHQKNAAMMEMIAATAPALGLLGTYVGLIPMLVSISDPSALGPMMALELVSSFYGAFLAYVVFSPLAKRLKVASGEEELRREVLIEGMVAILLGKNPRLIKEELEAYTNLDLDTEEEKQRQRELEQEERAANGYN